MGINYNSHTIIGWRVNREKAFKFLRKHEAGTCNDDENEPCFCGRKCWGINFVPPIMPEKFTLRSFSPYKGASEDEEETIVLELICEFELTVSEMIGLLTTTDFTAAQKLADELGTENTEASIFSECDIF